ncbi:MAG: GGDEF domain-containing protein [Succinivibrio sp.]
MVNAVKFEITFLVIALLLIIIRSFIREHDKTYGSFTLICYSIIFIMLLHFVSSLFSYANFSYPYTITAMADSCIGCILPYLWMRFILGRLGIESYLTQRIYFLISLIPLCVIVIAAFISPIYPVLFKINLFGEAVPGDYNFIMKYLPITYSAVAMVSIVVANAKKMLTDMQKEFAFLFAATAVSAVTHIVAGYQYNYIYYLVCAMIILIVFISVHEDRVFIDALTGLNNRNRFKKYLSSVMSSMSVNRANMFLTYIDIDEFKKINDNYGHVVGDLALRTVAEAMREIGAQTRSFIARLGGDEFAIISSHNSKEEYELMIQRLRKLLDEKASINFTEFKVGFSLGTTSLDVERSSINDLIKVADRRMYEQKRLKKLRRTHED